MNVLVNVNVNININALDDRIRLSSTPSSHNIYGMTFGANMCLDSLLL